MRRRLAEATARIETLESVYPENLGVQRVARERCGVEAVINDSWGKGAAGAEALAHAVVKLAQASQDRFAPLYPDDMPLIEKTRTIARQIYDAADISADASVLKKFEEFERAGYGKLPICVAKTPYSFTVDPTVLGAPSGHIAPIREIRLRAGAGFIVVLMGEIATMPGLPRVPAAEGIRVVDGQIEGLF